MARIAILLHEFDDDKTFAGYAIAVLAEFWREDGHEVLPLYGTARFVPADLILVHVDLSVVPEPYLAFARRYPIALNAGIGDIRRTTYSANLLRRGDSWRGPVIVKSNLNYHGLPEQLLAARGRARAGAAPVKLRALRYFTFASLAEVPALMLDHPDLVVEKFQPERDGRFFCVRNLNCVGDYLGATRIRSLQPMVNSENCLPEIEDIEPDPRILAARSRLRLDYGKLDYVVVDGEAILLDVNKTNGAGGLNANPQMRALRRKRANGLYYYLR
jgi:hypothetical protein